VDLRADPSSGEQVGASSKPDDTGLIADHLLTTGIENLYEGHSIAFMPKLNALKRHGSLTVDVGTAHPGPGDLYAPTLDCSQPTKPYEGYRTADHCRDDLSWSGTVKVTRTS
jgi:hypothetical protein